MKKLNFFLKQSPSNSEAKSITEFISLIQGWQEIVGEASSKHSIPLKLNHNVLTIITSHPSISSEMSFLSEMIKKKIFDRFPTLNRKIEKINFINNPTIFDQLKKDNEDYEAKKILTKNKKHKYNLEQKLKEEEASLFFGNELNGTDPEIKELMIALKIQKDS